VCISARNDDPVALVRKHPAWRASGPGASDI
jgi:hypothetical protein